MNGVKFVLVYNYSSYTLENYLKVSNIRLEKFTSVKINMELNYNSV